MAATMTLRMKYFMAVGYVTTAYSVAPMMATPPAMATGQGTSTAVGSSSTVAM